MAYNYSSRIDELEKLKEQKKILRQIQESKQRLLYSDPKAIGSFIKTKISTTLEDKIPAHYTTDQPISPLKLDSRDGSRKRSSSRKSQYLDLLKHQRSLIEKELKLMRQEEEKSRKNLERRVRNFIRTNEKSTNKNLKDLQNSMKLLSQYWNEPLTKNPQSDIYNELRKLKQQYIRDGGKDPVLLKDFDNMMMEQELQQMHNMYPSSTNIGMNTNYNWPEKRKEAVLTQRRANDLRDLERQIAEIENQIEIDKARSPFPKKQDSLKAKRNENENFEEIEKYNFDYLHQQIYELQKEIQTLKQNKQTSNHFLNLSPTPRLDGDIEDKLEKKNIILRLDYITGVSLHIKRAIITATLYMDHKTKTDSLVISQPIELNPVDRSNLNNSFVIDLQIPILECAPKKSIFILIEMKTSNMNLSNIKEDGNDDFISEAWTKIPIFMLDESHEARLGKWRLPLYVSPARPDIEEEKLYQIPQYHRGFIHYRIGTPSNIVDLTDEQIEEFSYENFDKAHVYNKFGNKFEVKRFPIITDDNGSDRSDVSVELEKRPEFGIQISRVKHINLSSISEEDSIQKHQGDLLGHVHITAYHSDGVKRGQILMSRDGPVTCTTNLVKADFKEACYQFGRQMQVFQDVDLSFDSILIARFYVKHDTNGVNEKNGEAFLVAWSAFPLVKRRTVAKRNPGYVMDSLKLLCINKGLHDIKLYEPPVLPPSRIFFDKLSNIVGQKKFWNGKLKFRLFHTRPIFDSATSSDDYSGFETNSDDAEEKKENKINKLWIGVERPEPLTSPYNHENGLDLYIDQGRFFPDGSTAIKLEFKLVDRNMQEYGPKMSSVSLLDSDIHNPLFLDRYEIRDPTLPPSTTLLIRIKTFDRETKKLVVLGYSALNMFVETGTYHQPKFDNLGVLISINDQGHQIPIYKQGPTENDFPFRMDWFKENNVGVIPGASLLIRLYKPPVNSEGRSINIEDVPINHQRRLGVQIDPPAYEEGFYLSMACKPVDLDDWRVLRQLDRRPELRVRDLMNSDWAAPLREKAPTSEMIDQKQFNKIFIYFNELMENDTNLTVREFNLNHAIQYHPEEGFKISIDGAINLPWNGYTFGFVNLYPPGSMYMAKPYLTYDRPFFFTKLDFNSSVSSPVWQDGWKTYRHRKFDENLIAIIHLQEMNVKTVKEDFKFSLENEAWIPLQIFDGPYAITRSIQLPLILGSPQYSDLDQLKVKNTKEYIAENLENRKIKFISPASIIVRQCDSRRSKEISISADKKLLSLDQSFIPPSEIGKYSKAVLSRRDNSFKTIIPAGFTEESFQELLRVKFRSLVYKYYEENGFQRL